MTIAAYIQQDLEARIRAGVELPTKLTLQALAEHYQVSLTPVREATDALLARGLLQKASNRRLRVSPAENGTATEETANGVPKTPTNWDDVIMLFVLTQSLKGEARFLREEALTQRFGIGRSQVRRILSRLSGIGVIEHIQRRGWRVRPFHPSDLSNYLDIRETLELKALDLARAKLDRTELKRMSDGNLPLSKPEGNGHAEATESSIPRLDNRLHHYFVEQAGNRYIRDFFARYGGYFRVLFDYAALGADVVATMAAQHVEILQHLLGQRWEAARRSLAEHIRAQGPNVLEVISRLESDPERLMPEEFRNPS